jgi:hypothetical protein
MNFSYIFCLMEFLLKGSNSRIRSTWQFNTQGALHVEASGVAVLVEIWPRMLTLALFPATAIAKGEVPCA